MCIFAVTPLAGVWIEISNSDITNISILSLPLRECGLKYMLEMPCYRMYMSLPLRECGLKLKLSLPSVELISVTPLAGVWIEICLCHKKLAPLIRHSPCGSVD